MSRSILTYLVPYLFFTRLHRSCPRNAPFPFTMTNRYRSLYNVPKGLTIDFNSSCWPNHGPIFSVPCQITGLTRPVRCGIMIYYNFAVEI